MQTGELPTKAGYLNYQPRPQGFSLKKWVGRHHRFFNGKALGTRLLSYLGSPTSV